MKCADNTVICGIANIDDSSHLLLTVSRTEELTVDFREKEVKTEVNSFRFLGINITENL